MKRMIRLGEKLECRARSQSMADVLDQVQGRELIASALEEEHRDFYAGKMLGTFLRRLAGRMEWKPGKDQTAHSVQRGERLCLGSHAAAEGLATGKQREPGKNAFCFLDGSTHDRMRDLRRVRSRLWSCALFHVEELITQGGDIAFSQSVRNGCHERVGHPGSGA